MFGTERMDLCEVRMGDRGGGKVAGVCSVCIVPMTQLGVLREEKMLGMLGMLCVCLIFEVIVIPLMARKSIIQIWT